MRSPCKPLQEGHVSDDDLESAAQALRALAVRYRNDANRQRNPIVRERLEKSAAECERVAERMKKSREVSAS